MQAISQSQKTFPEQARIPNPSSAVLKAHQIFRHARPHQFTASGRKRRITQERDRRTAQAQSHFDQGAGVWASLKTIFRELLAMEARHDPDDQMTWSQATLCRSLVRFESGGILKPHGIHRIANKRWGARQRSLHPEKLLPRCECEIQIPTNVRISPRESGKLEVKDFKTSGSLANSRHPKNRKIENVMTIRRHHFPKRNFQNPSQKPKAKSVEIVEPTPNLRSWMDSRILGRAQNQVRSNSAYLRASRPEFLANLGEEVEMCLVEQAQQFMRHRLDEVSSVNFEEVYELLRDRVVERGLPVRIGKYWNALFSRVYDSAADILGLSSVDEGDAPAPAPVPPTPGPAPCVVRERPEVIENSRQREQTEPKQKCQGAEEKIESEWERALAWEAWKRRGAELS
jgi:hypothetical protein